MGKFAPKFCANCKHWKPDWTTDAYIAYDAKGECKKNPNVSVYGDEEACDKFKDCKRMKVNMEDWWK